MSRSHAWAGQRGLAARRSVGCRLHLVFHEAARRRQGDRAVARPGEHRPRSKKALSADRPPASAGGRSTPARRSPGRRVTSKRHTTTRSPGVQRAHTSAVNSPRPHSRHARPLRFRPSSRHTGRSLPGSTHAVRSGSSSWRSGTRSASGTRSCRPCRGPAR